MRKLLRSFVLIVVFLTLATISSKSQVRIAVSKTSERYENWLHYSDPGIVIVNMYGLKIDSALSLLSGCRGLLLTGGEDVNPARYGKGNELAKCEEINNYRDSLEFALIGRAVGEGMPVFGICRGEQILNVALGGSLLTDIPTDVGNQVIHRCPPGSEDCLHMVRINPGSQLLQITSVERGTVNSFHHQAVDRVAPGMKVTALSDDGVAEAIERESPAGKSFVIGVQWHPEALKKNPALSRPLADYFISRVREFDRSNKSCCSSH